MRGAGPEQRTRAGIWRGVPGAIGICGHGEIGTRGIWVVVWVGEAHIVRRLAAVDRGRILFAGEK